MPDGFSVPFGRQSWRAFTAAGHLPRLCRRLCALAASRAELGFELRGERLEFRLGDQAAALQLGDIDDDTGADEGIQHVLALANTLLECAAIEPRFELVSGERSESAAARGIHFGYRVTLGEGDALPAAREVAGAGRVFDRDPSYPALLARHAEELARFAGVSLRCTPSPTLADSRVGPDKFSLAVVIDDFLHLTVTVPTAPLDLQPIFDCINSRLERRGQRLCRVLDEPWGEIAVLAGPGELAALRAHGDLLEPDHERTILAAIGRGGFALEAMSGWWSSFAAWGLPRCLLKIRELCRDEAALAWSIERSESGGLTLRLPCNGAEEVATYGPELDQASAADVFIDVVAQLNRALAGGEAELRALVMTGEPLFYGRRLVLLPADWAAQVSRLRQCVSGAVGPGDSPPAWPITYPERAIEIEFPRIPDLDELLPAGRICDHDFKCSARPTDFYDLVVELGEFAGLEINCPGSSPGPEPGEITLHARWRDRDLDVVVFEAKYLDVTPILERLNEILAELDDPYRLHLYRGGGYEGGLIRATEAELVELRRYGYLAALPA